LSSNAARPEPLPGELAEPLGRAAARLGAFASRIFWYADVPSTNDLAGTLAERGAPEGTIIVANAQRAGRGRHGRTWVSPPGVGLYVSAVLRPAPRAVPLLTVAAGVAVAEGIQAATGLDPEVKWPNDVYVGGRKVAGILAEASSGPRGRNPGLGARESGAGVQYVVLGFGINVLPAPYPPEVAARATSLEGELGRAVDRGLLFIECLCALSARYGELQGGRTEAVMRDWRTRAATMRGRAVSWERGGRAWHGRAEDVDETGALLVRTDSGLVRVISGEVRWM
jgi:BirA family transcriptional regulator, biotin operon repressor / biotin---[acetyl-CoA-carboxylase] ligase